MDLAHKTDAAAAATADATGQGSGTTQAQGSRREGAIEIGKSISQLRMRLTRPKSWRRSRWTPRTRRPKRRTKTPSNWNVLQPSEWQKSRRRHGQCRLSASEQRRRRRACRWRKTRKRPSPWNKTMKSSNCCQSVEGSKETSLLGLARSRAERTET